MQDIWNWIPKKEYLTLKGVASNNLRTAFSTGAVSVISRLQSLVQYLERDQHQGFVNRQTNCSRCEDFKLRDEVIEPADGWGLGSGMP